MKVISSWQNIKLWLGISFISISNWMMGVSAAILYEERSVLESAIVHIVTVKTYSRIECGSACIHLQRENSCTAFHLEPALGQCSCGIVLSLAETDSSPTLEYHVNTQCGRLMQS